MSLDRYGDRITQNSMLFKDNNEMVALMLKVLKGFLNVMMIKSFYLVFFPMIGFKVFY